MKGFSPLSYLEFFSWNPEKDNHNTKEYSNINAYKRKAKPEVKIIENWQKEVEGLILLKWPTTMKCSYLSNLLSNLLLRSEWMILVPVAVTFILFTRQKLHSISSISESKSCGLFNNGGKMLRVGCKGFTRKNSRGKLFGGQGREIEKRFRVETLVTNAK